MYGWENAMNGELKDWVKEIDKLTDSNKGRLDKLEPRIDGLEKMSDERYDQFKFYLRATFGAALGTLITLLAKSIFKF